MENEEPLYQGSDTIVTYRLMKTKSKFSAAEQKYEN